MKQSSPLVLLVVLGLGCLSFRKAPPDLSSPKAAVRSFAMAIKDSDPEAIAACVKNGIVIPELKDFWLKSTQGDFIEVLELLTETNGNSAKAAVEYQIRNRTTPYVEMDILRLEKRGETWQIVFAPDTYSKMMTSPQQRDIGLLTAMGVYVGTPDGLKLFHSQQLRAQSISSLSNLKQIGTGVVMYIQDYDEVLPSPAAKYKDLLMPYLKDEKLFHAPAAPKTEKESYTFNTNLQGIGMEKLSNPSQTIMIYEGKNGKPDYRYEGKTVIAFADGHARLCSEEEVARFLWAEKAWKPRATKPVPVKPAPKKSPGKKR